MNTTNNKILAGIVIILLGLAIGWFVMNRQSASTPSDSAQVEPPPTAEAALPSGSAQVKTPLTAETTLPSDTLPPATAESPAFVGTIWTAGEILGTPILGTTTLTVQFDDQGRVTGSDGCNTFSGGYTTAGTELTIDPAMMSTQIGCEEAVMQQADAFTTRLRATTSYQRGDGRLILSQGSVAGLSFFGQRNPLSKTSWTITAYNNGRQAVVGLIQDTTLTITFGDDGTISGFAGCNTFSGQYSLSLSSQTITIGQVAVTRMACSEPEGIMEQEAAFLAALESAASWGIRGSQLDLRTADDELAIIGVNKQNL